MKLRLLIPLLLFACFASHSQSNAGAQEPQVNKGSSPAKEERSASSADALEPKLVTFPGPDHMTLHGFLYLPSGQGRFPAIIWNHGSEAKPGSHPDLGEFYTSKGFVLFIPHRHGQGRSADTGPYHGDLQAQCKSQECWIELHELYNKDVIAAVEWLKEQPFVDKDRIVMSGVSYGGIQTLLTAEKGAGIRAFVAFSPGAMSWDKHPDLRVRLLKAEQKAQRPIFLIQAEGDYNTGPYSVLGSYLLEKGGRNKAKLYPKFGNSKQEAHGVFATRPAGISIWQADVLAFLNDAMK
ncbi:MAG TPA: prolyl oligopeptidase family serine peptidase [Blastocatellia bacterium]|nr:prolyl oligopeptidase family serine peptidase [Blastocatellia bacterium]